MSRTSISFDTLSKKTFSNRVKKLKHKQELDSALPQTSRIKENIKFDLICEQRTGSFRQTTENKWN